MFNKTYELLNQQTLFLYTLELIHQKCGNNEKVKAEFLDNKNLQLQLQKEAIPCTKPVGPPHGAQSLEHGTFPCTERESSLSANLRPTKHKSFQCTYIESNHSLSVSTIEIED